MCGQWAFELDAEVVVRGTGVGRVHAADHKAKSGRIAAGIGNEYFPVIGLEKEQSGQLERGKRRRGAGKKISPARSFKPVAQQGHAAKQASVGPGEGRIKEVGIAHGIQPGKDDGNTGVAHA